MDMLKKTGAAFALALALGAGSYHAAHAELITNGKFETGDFTGWTLSGATDHTGVDSSDAASGAFGAYFGQVGADGFLTQTIATTAGQNYAFSFDLANGLDLTEGDTTVTNDFAVSFDGASVLSFADAPIFGYTHFSFNKVASGPSTTIQFTFREDPDYYSLDNVSVTPAAVPEPSSAAFMIIGAAFLGSLALRRRSVRAC